MISAPSPLAPFPRSVLSLGFPSSQQPVHGVSGDERPAGGSTHCWSSPTRPPSSISPGHPRGRAAWPTDRSARGWQACHSLPPALPEQPRCPDLGPLIEARAAQEGTANQDPLATALWTMEGIMVQPSDVEALVILLKRCWPCEWQGVAQAVTTALADACPMEGSLVLWDASSAEQACLDHAGPLFEAIAATPVLERLPLAKLVADFCGPEERTRERATVYRLLTAMVPDRRSTALALAKDTAQAVSAAQILSLREKLAQDSPARAVAFDRTASHLFLTSTPRPGRPGCQAAALLRLLQNWRLIYPESGTAAQFAAQVKPAPSSCRHRTFSLLYALANVDPAALLKLQTELSSQPPELRP